MAVIFNLTKMTAMLQLSLISVIYMEIKMLPELTKKFEKILMNAQKSRSKRMDLIDLPEIKGVPFDRVPEWNVYELEQMLDAVNQIRKNNHASFDDIRKAERNAVGHSDYTHKFALYCAELALKGK
jgi:hypothetical protein